MINMKLITLKPCWLQWTGSWLIAVYKKYNHRAGQSATTACRYIQLWVPTYVGVYITVFSYDFFSQRAAEYSGDANRVSSVKCA